MAHVALITNDPTIRTTMRTLIREGGYMLTVIYKFTGDEMVADVQKASPDVVVIDCGGLTISLMKELRKTSMSLAYVVIVENEGSMFLSHLSTPRIQYISGRSRETKLLMAIEYSLAGKSTLQRLQENGDD